MRERIFSLETEYAVCFLPAGAGPAPGAGALIDEFRRLLAGRYGLPHSAFLVNGSKFYHDQGHAEWSLPECRSAYEAAVYDRAADRTLAGLIPEVEGKFQAAGQPGRVLVAKNNVDAAGKTWGCHENYLARRQTEWLGAGDHLRLTVRYLVPFLVTRQLVCGSGRVGLGAALQEGAGFQIMQRADFIDAVVSTATLNNRALINLGRENEPFAPEGYRRLHLILADANVSSWATYLKLGTTGLVLRLLEELRFGDLLHLQDPLGALRAVSRDPTCRARVRLRDGRELTALEIQRAYLDQARAGLERPGLLSPEEGRVLALWQEVLDGLAGDRRGLFGKVDWVTKKLLLDRSLGHRGVSWGAVAPGRPAYFELLQKDLHYHSLSPEDGLYRRLEQGGAVPALVADEEWKKAESAPPPYTRARVRGDVIRAAREAGGHVEVDSWDRVDVGPRRFALNDPLEFFSGDVLAALGQ